MTDEKRFRFFIVLSALLTIGVISYNVFEEYMMPDIEGYWQRRLYYERVISKKGLDLHKGKYWKKTE